MQRRMHHLREKCWRRWRSLVRDRGKCVLQISAKPSWETSVGPGFIRGLHLVQGITVKGAGPADRLALDGHYSREQGLVTTGCRLTVIPRAGGPCSGQRGARLRARCGGEAPGRLRRLRRLPVVRGPWLGEWLVGRWLQSRGTGRLPVLR